MQPTTIKIDPYNSATGSGTLGYYARKYNTTVDNLLSLNKGNSSVKNANTIIGGGSLNVPTVSTPSVVTSTVARDAVTNAENYINNQRTPVISNQQQVQNNTPDVRSQENETNVTNYSSFSNSPEVQAINNSYDSYSSKLKSNMDLMMSGLDAQASSMVNSIMNTYAKRIEQQKDVNTRYLESKRMSGYSSGRARYASEMQDDILSSEEQAGITRINDLEAERQSLIQKAQEAKDEKSRAALVDYQNQLIEVNKQKTQAVNDLFKNTMDTERFNLDVAKESRASIKDRIDTSIKTAESIAGSVVDYIDSNKLSTEEKNSIIADYADMYGISEDYLKTAISGYRLDISKSNPTSIREYEYVKNNQGFKGSLLDYERAKKNATTVARSIGSSGSGSAITFSDASRFDLPESLIGKSEKEIIMDLAVSKPPKWFENSQINAGHIQPGYSPQQLKSQWETFRNMDDILVLRNTVELNKGSSSTAKATPKVSGDATAALSKLKSK